MLFLVCFNPVFASDSDDFSIKLSKCFTCHTATGNSVVSIWPKIAGQHFDYIIKQLIEFKKGKNGARFDPNMLAMLQGFNEDELYKLAQYFSKQVLEKSKGKVNISNFELGRSIYFYGNPENNLVACIGCHGVDGLGNKLAKFPVLKWQHKDYFAMQIKKFKNNERSNDFNGIMRDIASLMSEKQINAVSEYLAFIK